MIQLNITEKDLETSEQVLNVVNKIMLSRAVSKDGRIRLEKCFNYYNGVEPLTIFEEETEFMPRVINITKPIVDIATETFIGDLPDIVTRGKSVEKEKISAFNQKLYDREFGDHIFETAHYGSKGGTGFLALYNEVGDKFPRFRELNPLFADSVYDCTLAKKHLCSYFIVENEEINEGGTPKSTYVIYIYTKNKVFAFETSVSGWDTSVTPDAKKMPKITPYFAWTKKTENGEEDINVISHDFGDIPIVEFPNNEEYIGDAECAFELISLYNDLQNNRCKNVHDIVNYILMLKNVRVGDDEAEKRLVRMLKENRLLPVEGDNVDAKFLSNPLNQEQLQTLANNIKDLIHYITRVPDLSSVDFSQNASDPIIKIKTKPLLDLCKNKEKKFTSPYKKVLKMVMHWCEINDKDSFNEYNFDLSLTTLKYTHTLPSNDSDMITMITNLTNSGLANPEILLQELSFIPSVSEYLKGVKKHNEYVDKRKLALQNINKDSGSNEHNIQLQNEKPLTKEQMDNKKNFDRGNANTLSDEKVD